MDPDSSKNMVTPHGVPSYSVVKTWAQCRLAVRFSQTALTY